MQEAASQPIQNLSLIATADYTTKQYYAVKIASTGKMTLAGAGENAVGILQDTPDIDQVGCVMALGVSWAKYGDTVVAGANLTPDSAGRLVTAGGSDCVIGVALFGGAVNTFHPVLLVTRTATGTVGIAHTHSVVSIPIDMTLISGNGDVVTDYIPGFAGTIIAASFLWTVAGVGVGAEVALNLEIETTNVTGGVITLLVAAAAKGAVIAGTAISAANTFSAVQKISVEAAFSSAFSAGEGVLLLTLQTVE